MKILYAGTLRPEATVMHRLWALERLGHTVIPFNVEAYAERSVLLRKLSFRLSAGLGIERLNRDLLRIAEAERPDLFWGDKMLSLRSATLAQLGAMGIMRISYLIDNPFGARRDPGWRLFLKNVPFYDLHVVQRDRNIVDYRAHGARDVVKIQTAYEPTLHFPPPEEWSDLERTRQVSFIGTPYDDRAALLARLWREQKCEINVNGSSRAWRRALDRETYAALWKTNELYGTAYREAIWRSKINLSFLTQSNQDEFAHKSFEIAGCGGFLLAERSEGHRLRFVEGEEAVFFSGFDELAAKIRRYLPDEAARSRIAAAGRARAVRSGYDNDRQMGLILARVEELVASSRTERLAVGSAEASRSVGASG